MPSRSEAVHHIALPWVIRLRYAEAVWQIVRLAFARLVFHVDVSLALALVPPSLVLLSNFWLSWRVRRSTRFTDSTLIAAVFFGDTLCFTSSLMLTGGPDNPYSMLYLVNIALSATIMRPSRTRMLAVFSVICFALSFRFYIPLNSLNETTVNGHKLHLIGTFGAFSAAAILVAVFSGKVSELLRERAETMLRMQEELAKKDRLASLVTLAAGAAHELSTPLGTIAIVARELERYATRTVPNTAIALDSRLIRDEVERCSRILRRMSIEGAEPTGEAPATVSVGDLLASVRDGCSAPDRLRIRPGGPAFGAILTIPPHAVQQALLALVSNALDASPGDEPVELLVDRPESTAPGAVRFIVQDRGHGMSDESLRRAGEPFYTTKEPGKGMGLGIFLVRTLADRLGGRLTLKSSGAGTTATLELPATKTAESLTP